VAYTEFYCDAAAGANINAGDKTANGVVTSTNGAWSTVTNIFTATAGTPFSGVSVGDFASVYNDGATVAVYIARVTAIGGGGLTLTLSTTAISGTAPTTSATGRSCTTGGAWKGPSGAVGHPFDFVENTLTNSSGNPPRVNLKNGTNYAITATINQGFPGPMVFQGYTATAGDGGRAIIDGGATGTSFTLLDTVFGNNYVVKRDLIFQNNGDTGASPGASDDAVGGAYDRCVFNSLRSRGLLITNQQVNVSECEFYACNQNNDAVAALQILSGSVDRCFFHDNTGDTAGARVATSGSFVSCVFDSNGGGLFCDSPGTTVLVKNCDFYNQDATGIEITAATTFRIENCNFIKNGTYGILNSGDGVMAVRNCGFGAGTQANTSGTINASAGTAFEESGNVTYVSNVTPWVDPANGDFRITLTAAKGAGRGSFTQTAASYTGTIGYPDIGAAQHLESASGGSFTFVS
jgi:hypothetical protein